MATRPFLYLAPMVQLILASQSPRRRRLIEHAGLAAHVLVADVDEESVDHPDPATNVAGTALLKAEAAAERVAEGLIIAADTTVALDGEMLGKPSDEAQAMQMLARLRGRIHQVYTGLVILRAGSGKVETAVCQTDVFMRSYTDGEIAGYIDSGDPFDKAGAYAIQNHEFHPVKRIRGCYTNVVGLPLCRVVALLARFGVPSALPLPGRSCDYQTCTACLELMAADGIDGLMP